MAVGKACRLLTQRSKKVYLK